MSRTQVDITRLTPDDIVRRLRTFEHVHAHTTGEEISSEVFFARFRNGEFDTLFGMEWAAYWRAYTRLHG